MIICRYISIFLCGLYKFVNILTKSDGIDNLKTLLDLGYNFNVFINKLKEHSKANIPGIKWYTFLNYPNKQLGKITTLPIYLHKDKCMSDSVLNWRVQSKSVLISYSSLSFFDILS